jgi:hypothetical protein
MLPMIQQAMFYGFSAAQVLKYFSSKFPAVQQPINAAVSAGFAPEKILEYLVKNPQLGFGVKNKKQQEQVNKQFETDYEKYTKNTGLKKEAKDITPYLAAAGTAAAAIPAAYGAYRGAQGLYNFANSQTLKNFVSGQLFGNNPMAANLLNATGGQGQAQQAPVQQPPAPPQPQQAQPAPQAPQAQPGLQPGQPPQAPPNQPPEQAQPIPAAEEPEPQPEVEKPIDIINFLGIGKRLETLVNAGNESALIARVMPTLITGPQKKYLEEYLKKSGIDANQFFESAIQDSGFKPRDQSMPFAKGLNVLTPDGKDGVIEAANDKHAIVSSEGKKSQHKIADLIKSAGNLFKENTNVGLPGGDIGRIVKMMGNKAQVEVDGKLKEIDASKLEQEPEEVKELDLEGLAQKYLQSIPEERKSAVFNSAVYQPSSNTMIVKFHNGDTWAYSGVNRETFDRIINEDEVARTSGKDGFTGAVWQEGEKSRGGGFHKLIKEAVKRGEITEEKLDIGFEGYKELHRKSKKKKKTERG